MEVGYSLKAQEDILFWKKSGNKKNQQRISQLIFSIEKTPLQELEIQNHLNIIYLVYGQEELIKNIELFMN